MRVGEIASGGVTDMVGLNECVVGPERMLVKIVID